MIGKKIAVNDYKFTYGKETIYMFAYGSFIDAKKDRYIVYSYSNNINKIYYGSFFVNGKMGTVMISGSENIESVKLFIEEILNNKDNNQYTIVNLKDIENVQIIDEKPYTFDTNIELLYRKTIPREIVKEEKEDNSTSEQKKVSLPIILIILLFIGVGIYFLINAFGGISSKEYLCTKSYKHAELPANVTEENTIIFNNKELVTKIKNTYNYVFTSDSSYTDFRDNGSSKYMEDGDTYKVEDDANTYRIFKEISIDKSFVLPKEEKKLITYYIDVGGYNCNIKEE